MFTVTRLIVDITGLDERPFLCGLCGLCKEEGARVEEEDTGEEAENEGGKPGAGAGEEPDAEESADGVLENIVNIGETGGHDELEDLDADGYADADEDGVAETEGTQGPAEGNEQQDVAKQVIQGDDGGGIAEEIAEGDPANRASLVDARLPEARHGDHRLTQREQDDEGESC